MITLRKKPYTREELFNEIWKRVEEKDESVKEFIDYALSSSNKEEIRTTDFRFTATIDYGCEGVYVDIFIDIYNEETQSSDRYNFGTVKTLQDTDEAFVRMGTIFGQFLSCANAFTRENDLNFEFMDCTVVKPCRADGTEVYGRYCYSNEEYEAFVKDVKERYPKVNVYDLKERKTYIA